MLNCQLFGTKKLSTHHLVPWNKPPKVPISKWVENFHASSAFHQESIATKSSWFHFSYGWELNSQIWMANDSTIAKSTFGLQSFLSPKLLQLHMHIICFSKNSIVQTICQSNSVCKDMHFQRNSKWNFHNENKNDFLFGSRGQIVLCMLIGGMLIY
jgi:hypothetical protein